MAVDHTPSAASSRVVIAGGGVAALETVLALRPLVGSHVEIELVTPAADFVYQPASVAEPFDGAKPAAFELAAIANDLGVRLRHDALARVDAGRQVAVTESGARLPYDALMVAVGASRRPWLAGSASFGGHSDAGALRELLDALASGRGNRVAFCLPPDEQWSLPLYELALLTQRHLERTGVDGARVVIVTPERAPLGVFGHVVSDHVADVLAAHGIVTWTESYAAFYQGPRLQVVPDGILFVDAVAAVARLEGRAIDGLPSDMRGFIPTDEYARVLGVDNVYAAGDGTTCPLKQGGVATQQADVAAQQIAAALGAPVETAPFRPVLRGVLLGADKPLYLRSEQGGRVSTVDEEPLWWPAAKIAGRYLSPYLAERTAQAA